MKYLLDANVFISASAMHYSFDFCPAFWDWLVLQNRAGKVFSIEHVGREIIDARQDQVSEWAKSVQGSFFLDLTSDVRPALTQTAQWLKSRDQGYTESAVRKFMLAADYYLVAYALSTDFAVVTHEIPAKSTNKVKIPDVCAGLSVKVMTPYQMLRNTRARFVLGKPK
ncbi:MAG: DUF4411 family protein [Gammaproteobacteria bacterium]